MKKNTSLVSPRDLIDGIRFGVYSLFNLLKGCALTENFLFASAIFYNAAIC